MSSCHQFYRLLNIWFLIIVFATSVVVSVIAPQIDLEQKMEHEYKPVYGVSADGNVILKNLIVLPGDESTSDLVKYSEDRGVIEDELEPGSVIWQLFSQSSRGFLQLDETVNARGSTSSPCKINFIVRVVGAGSIVLKHAVTKKYVCFNRRKRITMRADPNDIKCHFIEKMNSAGYTMLESTWWPRLYLGFNHKGRFQDPSRFSQKYRCFLFTKLEHYASPRELQKCSNRMNKKGLIRRNRDGQVSRQTAIKMPDPKQLSMDNMLVNNVRKMLLKRIQVE